MTIAILCDPATKEEILLKGIHPSIEIYWVDSLSALNMMEADAWFDLQFRNDPERIQQYGQLRPLFLGANEITCTDLPADCYRINDWPGMLNRSIIEITAAEGSDKATAEKILGAMGWNWEWTPDIPGFISNRVIAGIVNEAYFTFEAGTSSKEEIDTAMKLGTNYPFGPFEWSKKIGLDKILGLLQRIAHTDDRYTPSAALIKDINELDS